MTAQATLRVAPAAPDTITCDVAVVGAGPYGLSAAAHLRAVAGLDVHVLGEPMSFWQEQMPDGMLLRSPREASNLSDPDRALTLDAYEAAVGLESAQPVPLARFVAYGRWFQQQAVPELDRRRVERVERTRERFRLELADGCVIRAGRVVIAGGIAPFARLPPELAALPPELVSHAVEHRDLRGFAGRHLVVVGGGQSALESAALLHEAGTDVDVLVREPRVNWLVRSSRLHRLQALRRLLYAPADIGPAGVSWLVATPRAFTLLPRRVQDPLARRSIRPAASGWLVPRLESVRVHLGRRIVRAASVSGTVQLDLDDGRRLAAEHVLLGTGYRIDVARYPLLAPGLVEELRIVDGHPVLDRGFQSSVPGLHFLGAPAAWSWGPLFRFVAGTGFAARAVARRIEGPWPRAARS